MALNGVRLAAILLVGALLLPLAAGQIGECPLLQPEELGRLDAPSREGLIPPTYTRGDLLDEPLIQILDYHIVCMSTGNSRDTYRYLSVIVNYTCALGDCENNRVVAQFDMSCIVTDGRPGWEMRAFNRPHPRLRMVPADGNFSTVPRSDCQACLSHEIAVDRNLDIDIDNSTHCAR